MKIKDVVELSNSGLFQKLSSIKLNNEKKMFKFGLELNDIAEQLNKILKRDRDFKIKLFSDFGTDDGKIKPENINTVNELLASFYDEDVIIDIKNKICIDEVEKSDLSPIEYAKLSWIIYAND